MAETALISITDVQTYRSLSPTFNAVRFNAFAMEVQRKNLRELFGDALYYAFMNDARTSGIYAELLNGKEYTYESNTIQYYGLKPILVYWWLALMAREGDLFHANIGSVQFVNNQQQSFEQAKDRDKIAAQYMETAQTYANDVIQFLNQNSIAYPLWQSDEETSPVNFVTFKI